MSSLSAPFFRQSRGAGAESPSNEEGANAALMCLERFLLQLLHNATHVANSLC